MDQLSFLLFPVILSAGRSLTIDPLASLLELKAERASREGIRVPHYCGVLPSRFLAALSLMIRVPELRTVIAEYN
jgi:hypothetical protein